MVDNQPIHNACDIIFNEMLKIECEIKEMEMTLDIKIYNSAKERLIINSKLLTCLREKALREEGHQID